MTTEQEGAPSATAGGAPAPTIPPAQVRATAEYLARMVGCYVAEVREPGQPAQLREIANSLHALLGEADCPGVVSMAHVRYLFRLVEGHLDAISDGNRSGTPKPDPRDAEIERLRTALARYQKRLGDDLLSGGKLVERARAALRVDDGSTCIRASMDGVAGDVGRLCDEIERLREELRAKEQRSFDNYAELLNPIRAVFGKQPVDASHYRELRDGITRLISSHSVEATRHEQAKVEFGDLVAERDRKRRELADVTAEVTRLKRLVGNEDVSYDGWDQFSRHDAIVRCEEGWQEYLKVRDERDRLRQELDLIHEKHAAGLVTLRTDFTAAVNGLLPKPAEPRRWTVGDSEPEIGTRARFADGRVRTLRGNGWHYDECPEHCRMVLKSQFWAAMVKEGPAVEVVGTDG